MKKVIYVIIPEFLSVTNTLVAELANAGHKKLDTYIAYTDRTNAADTLCKYLYKLGDEEYVTIDSLKSDGDCILLAPEQASKFTEKVNNNFSDEYRVCQIFVLASSNRKNDYIYNSGFPLFRKYDKDFCKYFAEQCCEDDVYSVNCLPNMNADTDGFRAFFSYVKTIMNAVKEDNEEKTGTKIDRFRKQVQEEFDNFKKAWMRHKLEEASDAAYTIAKWTEMNNCLQSIGESMHSKYTEQMVAYEEKYRSFLNDLCDFELNYDCSMWSNWEDIIEMIRDFFEEKEC